MKDLLEFSVPLVWQVEMVKQNFWFIEHKIVDIVDFCERQETCEALVKEVVTNLQSRSASSSQTTIKVANTGPKGTRNASVPGRTNKHKGAVLSFNDSGGRSGCSNHPNSVNHQTSECYDTLKRIAGNYVNNGRPSNNAYKRQKYSDKKPHAKPTAGDLHTLLDTMEQVKNRLDKEIRQRNTENGKRKRDHTEKVENSAQNNTEAIGSTNTIDNFTTELEELSLSDMDSKDLEDLEPLSDSEFEA